MHAPDPSPGIDAKSAPDFVDRVSVAMERQYRLHIGAIVAVLLINLLAFGYLFAHDIYTNHMFPNALPQPWPSFRLWEGRWGTDLTYLLQGGAGIPLLSNTLAILVQIANGLLFASLLGSRSPVSSGICAALVSIHPFMLDYFAFGGDQLSFALGDTLILAGVSIAKRTPLRFLLAAVLFSLALSFYQPKIALMLTVVALAFLAELLQWRGTTASLIAAVRNSLVNAAAVVAGAALYLVELKLTKWIFPPPSLDYFAQRTQSSTLSEMIASIGPLLGNLRDRLLFETNLYPQALQGVLAALVVLFAALGVRRILAAGTGGYATAIALLLFVGTVALTPLCLYAPFIISKHVDGDAARFYVPFAYLLAFLVLMCTEMLRGIWTRRAITALAALLIATFVVRDAQILHSAYLAKLQELSIVDRLSDRLQSSPHYGSANPHSLVVFGTPPHDWPDLERADATIGSNFELPGFIHFRQVEALNFLAGRWSFQYPTRAEIELAAAYAKAHAPWPAAGSVTVLDNGVAVVVFEQPGANVSVTMARD